MNPVPVNPVPVTSLPASLLGLRFVVAFVLLALLPLVVWDLWPRLGIDRPALGEAEQLGLAMVGFAIACLAVLGFALWQPPSQPWGRPHAGTTLRTYAAFLVGWVAVLVGYLAAAKALGEPVVAQPQLRLLATGDTGGWVFWVVVLGSVVGAPLAEELVFRGYLQGALQQVLPPPLAIASTAVVFGLCHTLPYALPTALLGALFGWLYWRRGCLWPAVLAHTLHNAATVAITVFWPASLDLLYSR